MAGVMMGAGEYAPIPPVFGPVSPSPTALWSWTAAKRSAACFAVPAGAADALAMLLRLSSCYLSGRQRHACGAINKCKK